MRDFFKFDISDFLCYHQSFFLPVKLLQKPLEFLVVHVLLLRDDLHVHLLLLQLLLVSLQLDQGIFLLSLGRGNSSRRTKGLLYILV